MSGNAEVDDLLRTLIKLAKESSPVSELIYRKPNEEKKSAESSPPPLVSNSSKYKERISLFSEKPVSTTTIHRFEEQEGWVFSKEEVEDREMSGEDSSSDDGNAGENERELLSDNSSHSTLLLDSVNSEASPPSNTQSIMVARQVSVEQVKPSRPPRESQSSLLTIKETPTDSRSSAATTDKDSVPIFNPLDDTPRCNRDPLRVPLPSSIPDHPLFRVAYVPGPRQLKTPQCCSSGFVVDASEMRKRNRRSMRMSSGKLSIHQPKVKASALSNSIRLLESEMDNIILGTDGRPLAVTRKDTQSLQLKILINLGNVTEKKEIDVRVSTSASVDEAIGDILVAWIEAKRIPELERRRLAFDLRMLDDGIVDEDFPPLGRMQPISRFVNTDLALCVNPHAPEVLARPRPTAYNVRVNLPTASSTRVKAKLSSTLQQVFNMVTEKRHLRQDGLVVKVPGVSKPNMTQTLAELGSPDQITLSYVDSIKVKPAEKQISPQNTVASNTSFELLMTLTSASQYKEYDVVKVNKFGISQNRVMGIDGNSIYNLLPKHLRGKKEVKRNSRRFEEVIEARVVTANPSHFSIEYGGPNVKEARVYDYRSSNPQDAAEIVARISFLVDYRKSLHS